MRGWIKGLAAILCLGMALSAGGGFAEIAEWAQAQQAGLVQTEWARLAGGDAVNTAVKAKDITKQCQFKVSEGDRGHVTDNNVRSTWEYGRTGAWIGVRIPDGVTPGAIRIEWLFDPTGFELIEYDAGQNVIRQRDQSDTFPNIYTMFTLKPETKLIQLRMTARGQEVCDMHVYSEGVLPDGVQTWLPPVEKADMMVFSTHQDDEVIFLGGTIPYSDVVCNRPTITVYMTNCTRYRRREALECLWEMGSRHYPEFINLRDKRVGSINEGIQLWGGKDNILKVLVERIRHYKPEVIVTQDFNGEYGHNQHKIMARALPYAVEAAADPNQYPESYQKYGEWQVKKLYIHLYKQNEIRMDWLTPQPACGGLTLLKVAQNGMKKHASQTKYYSVKDGGQYDNARFGLYISTVGEDVAKNDFFENIDADASSKYLETARAEAAAAQAALGGDAEAAEDDAWTADGAEAFNGAPDGDSETAGAEWQDADDEQPDGESLTGGESALETEDGPAYADEGANAPEAATAGVEADGAATGGAKPPVARERGSSAAAIALIGLGVVVAGAGAWYFMRLSGRKRRGRVSKARRGMVGRAARKPAGRHATKR